ncbi:hypothetical protein IWW50_004800 [Coemansia erecta]|nr:hypothetical protein IWW50_004800 [Coemansia erecta]
MADPPPSSAQYKDCLSCKIVSVLGMAGVSLFALNQRRQLDPIKFAARRRGILGISVAALGLAAYRLSI